jgi:4-phytase/acid phosphatase
MEDPLLINRSQLSLAVIFCSFAWTGVIAQSSPAKSSDTLKMVVILSRHGVRSPTWTLDRMNAYSSLPWPAWKVPPGDLTSRGFDLLKKMGAYDRASLTREDLFSGQGCAPVSETYIWADTDQRTLASGHALGEGLFPNCHAEIHSLADGNDPLFHPTAQEGAKPANLDNLLADFSKRAHNATNANILDLAAQLQRVLRGCKPDVDCTPLHSPESTLSDLPTAVVRGKGDKLVSLNGPLPLASTFSEDLLLEYTEGMPLQSVGWGNVSETQISRFLALHSAYFDLMHRTPGLAKMEASNMLTHIVSTLQQGAEGQPVAGALGDPGKKLVLLVGHDTNLAGISELLGLHWALDGREDDTPPGTELAFELWQSKQGTYTVRTTVTMQTIHQMREVQDLTSTNPPARQVVIPRGCIQVRDACRWNDFRALVSVATAK